jgi:hypothetical protein
MFEGMSLNLIVWTASDQENHCKDGKNDKGLHWICGLQVNHGNLVD